MELMAASVYVGDGTLEVLDVPVPEPGPGEVRIEIAQCGICGTDLHFVLERIARPGSTLGHEWAGTIVALGEGVDDWEIGRRVVCGPEPGCGECFTACRADRPSVCLQRPATDHLSFRGTFARYVVAPAARLVAVPEHLPSRATALTEPTTVALHTVTLSKVTPDDRVLVTGAGPVGLLVTAVLHAPRGARHHGVGAHAGTPGTGAGRRHGAHGHAGLAPEVADGPSGARAVHGGVRVLGEHVAGEAAIDQLDFAGVCVFVGTGHDFPKLNHNRVIILDNTILGSYNYDAGGFAPTLELAPGVRCDAARHAGRPVDVFLDELLPVMRRSAAGELPGKVMVRPERRTPNDDRRSRAVIREPTYSPRLDHVAMTMPPDSLDEQGRAEIKDFYGDVFGWTEGGNSGECRRPADRGGRPSCMRVRLPAPRRSHAGVPDAAPTSGSRCGRSTRSRRSWPRPGVAGEGHRVKIIDVKGRDRRTGAGALLASLLHPIPPAPSGPWSLPHLGPLP